MLRITRSELVLAALAAGKQAELSPVQAQKLFFLVDENLYDVLGGRFFDFQPYNYGPFDSAVYSELDALKTHGDVRTIRDFNFNSYLLTPAGLSKGQTVLEGLPPEARDYLMKASEFVRSLSFTELVAAIYKAYPKMRAKSVFRG